MNGATLASISSTETSTSYLTYLLTCTVSAISLVSSDLSQPSRTHIATVVDRISFSEITEGLGNQKTFCNKLPTTSPESSGHPAGRTAPPHEQSMQASRQDRIHFPLKVIDTVPRAERNCRQRNHPPLQRRRLGLSTPVAGLHLPTQ